MFATPKPQAAKTPIVQSTASRPNLWCTGEDSNLRSSKERQIYSLLPLTTRPPVHLTEPAPLPNCSRALSLGQRGRLCHLDWTKANRRRAKQTSAQTPTTYGETSGLHSGGKTFV